MKKVLVLLVLTFVMGISTDAAAAKWASSYHGEMDCFKMGIFLYPGDDITDIGFKDLEWYLGGDDFLDTLFCPMNPADGYRWQQWKQAGSCGRRVLAANLKINHAGFSGGRLYIVASGRKMLVGRFTPSDIGGRAIYTHNIFDITPYAAYLAASSVTLRIEIPNLPGGFGIDRGAIDAIEIEGYLF